MRKLWLIFKREYLARVRTRAFIFSTILLPLLFIGILAFSVAMAKQQSGRVPRIAIVDYSGNLAPLIVQHLTPEPPKSPPRCEIVKTIEKPSPEQKIDSEMLREVRQGQLDGYLVVPRDAAEGEPSVFHAENVGDFSLIESIHRAVRQAVIARRLEARGIHIADFDQIIHDVDLTLVRVTKEGETEEKGQTFIAAIVLTLILYTTLIMYGVFTMRSVLEEKTTRMVEILVASARPHQILAAKILGLASVALTQYLIWTVSGGALAAYATAMSRSLRPKGGSFPIQIPTATLAYLVVFFLAGYLLYASLYAAVGAMVSSEEDAQQMQWPVTLPLVVSFLLFNVILRNPNSNLSVALSMIPFCSPILMVLRIALQTPPLWQILLSLALLAGTTAGIVYFSAKIYRVGILMYGKRPSLVEVFHWLRYT